ncbi:hypothetical protein N7533_004656 [Penicillium manginii]|uniref:uncharacterized protein n=1 Tax=Penicillium manginii TaxID=203109 RepID=UPI0025488731|nr:uncharacterized protein N7533_004656 [Penicillium manginii]KAJ5755113.1 hypothetical protein N7533_004656 [Penicillium manginii]
MANDSRFRWGQPVSTSAPGKVQPSEWLGLVCQSVLDLLFESVSTIFTSQLATIAWLFRAGIMSLLFRITPHVVEMRLHIRSDQAMSCMTQELH